MQALPSAVVVIGIPTFRRPALLGALLATLAPQIEPSATLVVVADNDCGHDAPAVVAAFAADGMPVVCVPVSERGLAAVRNALITEACVRAPGWEWLAMLDDDGLAQPGWLTRLLAAGRQFDAHLVGGPVEGQLPPAAGLLARNSIFAQRRRWPTGPVPTLNTTQNLGIARKTLDLLGTPLFGSAYALSGGEDYELFRRVARAGGMLAWCDEAVVVEPAPQDRLHTRALLYRYASTGAYMAHIDTAYDGASRTWMRAIKGCLGAIASCLQAAVRCDTNAAAMAVLSLAHQTGRVGGMLGLRTSRYATPAPQRNTP